MRTLALILSLAAAIFPDLVLGAETAQVSAPEATIYRGNSTASEPMIQVRQGQKLTTGNRAFQGWIRVIAPGEGPAKSRVGWMRVEDLKLSPTVQGVAPPKPNPGVLWEERKPPQPKETSHQKKTRPVKNPNWAALFYDLNLLYPTNLQESAGYSAGYVIAGSYGLEIGRKLSPTWGLSLRGEQLSFLLQGFGAQATFAGAHVHYAFPREDSFLLRGSLGFGLLFGGELSIQDATSRIFKSPSFTSWYAMPRLTAGFALSSQFYFIVELFYRYVASKSAKISTITVNSQLGGGALGVGILLEF